MPPGPVHGRLAVVHSALVILDHAAKHGNTSNTGAESTHVSQSRQQGVRDDGGVYEKAQEDSPGRGEGCR